MQVVICRKTALGLACASRQTDLVIAFMHAGARDAGGDIDGLHRTLIRTGDHTSRRLLNSSPYTTAFRRKKMNGAQGPPNKITPEEPTSRQSRKDGTAQRRKGKEQEQENVVSAGALADRNSGGQPDAPKEASRRRLAATGVNSLRALLQQNAVVLAMSPSPSSKMAEEPQPKQVEPSVPRVRRGRGVFRGSEEAAAGDAAEPSRRQSVREYKVCSCSVRLVGVKAILPNEILSHEACFPLAPLTQCRTHVFWFRHCLRLL